MKNKFKPFLAAMTTFCLLGTMTACGDSDNNDNDRDSRSSADFFDNDGDDEKKVHDDNYVRNTEMTRVYSYAACIYDAANTSLTETKEMGLMESVFKSDKPVIICSDKSKDVNVSEVDNKFYEIMHEYFPEMDNAQWFIVVKKGVCEEVVVKPDDSEFIGRKPDFEVDASGNRIYEYDGMTFDEVYDKIVSKYT